jgi:hypothetical protein
MLKNKNNNISRFLYLNIYSFLLVLAGILIIAAPFYMFSKWTLIVQGMVAVNLFVISGTLFSTWESKKKEIELLTIRNQKEFRPDTFTVFMQAPCGRLIVREALRDLNKRDEYKSLLTLRKPLLKRLRDNCTPAKTVIYINEDFLRNRYL